MVLAHGMGSKYNATVPLILCPSEVNIELLLIPVPQDLDQSFQNLTSEN